MKTQIIKDSFDHALWHWFGNIPFYIIDAAYDPTMFGKVFNSTNNELVNKIRKVNKQ